MKKSARIREKSDLESTVLHLGSLQTIKPLTIQAAEILIGRRRAERLWSDYFKQTEELARGCGKNQNHYETAFYVLQAAMALYEKDRSKED